ncbi:MAG: YicC/YloC family endoribonuclease [Pseudomonadota bacterium]
MGNASAIQSMTGYSSIEGEREGVSYVFEARSVNGRSLDIRIRLPHGLERFEPVLRKAVTGLFRRGNVTVSLTVRGAESTARYKVNHEQIGTYLLAIQDLAASGSVAAPRADGLLALKGVIEGMSDDDTDIVAPVVEGEAAQLFDGLLKDRTAEGERIAPLIGEFLARMDTLRHDIESHPERGTERVRARLDRQVSDLVAGNHGLSVERLHQEAVILATRADVREELDRLTAHIDAARALLAEGGPVGRKLDFLAQELTRETNTICAKSPHHAVTALGLELKATVEQMREQVQNLE